MAFRTNKTPVLQTKSASGAVASFNTALAMPLVSCNIAVNAWQEGSGDPSPSNVRAIHGFSEVNATRAGKNLFDKTKVTYGKWVNLSTGAIEIASSVYCISDYILLKKGITYYIPDTKTPRRWIYDLNKNPISAVSTNSFTPTSDCYLVITIYTVLISVDIIQIEVGSTATAYEPYTGNTYPIQLGQEVYGAEVDVVNGVAHVTHYGMTLNGTENISRNTTYHYLSIPCPYNHRLNDSTGCISSHYIFGGSNKPRFTMGNIATLIWFFPEDDSPYYDNVESFKSYLTQEYANGTPVQIVYPLAEPFDIQLTPTQIETLIGNNTIFADTGDVDLTYKDLDIAKRGSFREVFKLPS